MHLGQNSPTVIVSEIFVIYQKNLLMFRRSSKSRRFPNTLMLPGGHVDTDEDILSSVVRETREETGVRVPKKSVRLKAVAVHNHQDRGETFLIFVFVAKITKPQKTSGLNEEGIAEWVPLEKLAERKDLFPIIKDYLPHIFNGNGKVLFTNITCRNSQIEKVQSWIES